MGDGRSSLIFVWRQVFQIGNQLVYQCFMPGLRLNIPAPVIVHKGGAGIAPATLPLGFVPYHELADTALVDTIHRWLVIDRRLKMVAFNRTFPPRILAELLNGDLHYSSSSLLGIYTVRNMTCPPTSSTQRNQPSVLAAK